MKDEHESMQEALAGFTLNALDDEDRTRIEELLAAHLPGCSECRAALEAFEYVVGEQRTLAFVVTKRGVVARPIAVSRPSLTKRVHHLRAQIEARNLNEGETARQLYDLLLAPLWGCVQKVSRGFGACLRGRQRQADECGRPGRLELQGSEGS